MKSNPHVFVSSSSESKPIAIAVVQALKDEVPEIKTRAWWEEIQPSRFIMDELLKLPDDLDAGVFIFDEHAEVDDGGKKRYPRDNVAMEYGAFASRLGRERCLICLVGGAVPPTNSLGVHTVRLLSAGDEKIREKVRSWVGKLKRREDWQLKVFWSQAARDGAIIVYPNEQIEFPEKARNPGIVTGSGEAVAMYILGRTLERLKIRGEEIHGTDSSKGVLQRAELVILLGSAAANRLVARIPEVSAWKPRFHFRTIRLDPGERFYQLRIEDTRVPSMQRPYGDNPQVGTDYALITFVADASSRTRILAMGGLSTIGTQAAAKFICSNSGIEQIFSWIGEPSDQGWEARPFEVVLKVSVQDSALGYRTEIVASNPRTRK